MRDHTTCRRVVRRAGAIGVASIVLAACWPMPGAGPNRRGHNELESAITTETVGSLAERWTVEPGGELLGQPARSAAGIHYVGRTASGQIALQTLRPATGEVLWTVTRGDAFHDAGDPVVVGDEVYVGIGTVSLGGRWSIAGLDTATGAPGPTIDGGLVGTARDRTLAHTSTGAIPTGQCATSTGLTDLDDPDASWWTQVVFSPSGCPDDAVPPTVGVDAVYHAGVGRNATDPGPGDPGNGVRSYSIDPPPECGTGIPHPDRCPTWATPLPGTSASSPVIGAGGATIYTATDTGTLYAVDATDGTILWSAPLGTRAGTPALADGSLFVPSDTGLHVLDADGCGADECAPIWTAGTVAHSGQPAVAGGVVFARGAGGLHAYAAAGCGATTCAGIWSTSPGSAITAGPVVTGGQLYVGTADGRLIAYGPAS